MYPSKLPATLPKILNKNDSPLFFSSHDATFSNGGRNLVKSGSRNKADVHTARNRADSSASSNTENINRLGAGGVVADGDSDVDVADGGGGDGAVRARSKASDSKSKTKEMVNGFHDDEERGYLSSKSA